MSAFSSVGDVFTDAEFSAPGNSFLWGLGALEELNRECAGFLIMPKRPYEWRVQSHGCYKFDNATIGLGPRDQSAHLPVFLHLRTTNLPGPSSVMRSEQAQQRRFERRHNKERMQGSITARKSFLAVVASSALLGARSVGDEGRVAKLSCNLAYRSQPASQ